MRILSVILFDYLYVTVKLIIVYLMMQPRNFWEQKVYFSAVKCVCVNGLRVIALRPSNGGYSVWNVRSLAEKGVGLREKWAYSEAFVLKFNQLWWPYFTGRSKAYGRL